MAPKKRMLDPSMISPSFDENQYEAITWYENRNNQAVRVLEVRLIVDPKKYRRKIITWQEFEYVSPDIQKGFYRTVTYEMMLELEKESKRTRRSRK